MSDIPEWAKKRAVSIANAEAGFTAWSRVESSFGMLAFARYIAAHEEPPVDPVEAAIIDMLPNAPQHPLEVVIRAAIVRGMTIAREQGQ